MFKIQLVSTTNLLSDLKLLLLSIFTKSKKSSKKSAKRSTLYFIWTLSQYHIFQRGFDIVDDEGDQVTAVNKKVSSLKDILFSCISTTSRSYQNLTAIRLHSKTNKITCMRRITLKALIGVNHTLIKPPKNFPSRMSEWQILSSLILNKNLNFTMENVLLCLQKITILPSCQKPWFITLLMADPAWTVLPALNIHKWRMKLMGN